MIKICIECGKEYEAIKETSKYCCSACKTKNYRERNKIQKKCEYCGEMFFDTSVNHSVKYCSTSCSSKITHIHITQNRTCVVCGQEFTYKGTTKKLYCDTCRKLKNKELEIKSNIKLGKIKEENVGIGSGGRNKKGKESPYFKTGIGKYREVKKLSMEDLKCEKCGSKERLEVHHIDEDRTNNELDNLILLCKPCHKHEHMGGEKNLQAKLTLEEVKLIRERIKEGIKVSELMNMFGVSKTTIFRIKNNQTWKIPID